MCNDTITAVIVTPGKCKFMLVTFVQSVVIKKNANTYFSQDGILSGLIDLKSVLNCHTLYTIRYTFLLLKFTYGLFCPFIRVIFFKRWLKVQGNSTGSGTFVTGGSNAGLKFTTQSLVH